MPRTVTGRELEGMAMGPLFVEDSVPKVDDALIADVGEPVAASTSVLSSLTPASLPSLPRSAFDTRYGWHWRFVVAGVRLEASAIYSCN